MHSNFEVGTSKKIKINFVLYKTREGPGQQSELLLNFGTMLSAYLCTGGFERNLKMLAGPTLSSVCIRMKND